MFSIFSQAPDEDGRMGEERNRILPYMAVNQAASRLYFIFFHNMIFAMDTQGWRIINSIWACSICSTSIVANRRWRES